MSEGTENMFWLFEKLGNIAEWCWVHWYIAVPVIIIFALMSHAGERIQRQEDIERAIKNTKKEKVL